MANGGHGSRSASERRRWQALVVLSVGQLMVVLDSTVGVALLASISASRTAHLLAQGMGKREALAGGFHLGFLVAAAFPVVAFFVTALLIRSRRQEQEMEADVVAAAEALTILE